MLTAGQVAADPGPWQLRGSDRRQLAPPVGGPGQAEAEVFGAELRARGQAAAEDAALRDRLRRAAGARAATRVPIPRGLVSAGPRWHSRFGGVIGTARPEPGRYVLGLEVGPEGRLALWDGGDVYTDLDAEAVEDLRDRGWAGESLLITTERRPFDEVDDQLAELAGALGMGISVGLRTALPGTGPGTGMAPAGPPGESRFREVAGTAEPGIARLRAEDGVVDLGRVRELLRNERVLGLVEAFVGLRLEAFVGLEPGQAD